MENSPNLKDKNLSALDWKSCIIITGANHGLGFSAAKHTALSDPSALIIMACRNLEKAEEARNRLQIEIRRAQFKVMLLDLASLASIRAFVKNILAEIKYPLAGLICNAGQAQESGLHFTEDGYEVTFAVNHLGHFLLTMLLLPHMRKPGRIVLVSSELHREDGPMKSFRSQFTKATDLAKPDTSNALAKDDHSHRYATSKLCNLLFMHSLTEKLAHAGINGITVNAINPGLMPDTALGGLNKKKFRKFFLKFILPLFARGAVSTPDISGKALAHLVTSEKLAAVTNGYFDRDRKIEPSTGSYDRTSMNDLWQTSIRLSNLQPAETIVELLDS